MLKRRPSKRFVLAESGEESTWDSTVDKVEDTTNDNGNTNNNNYNDIDHSTDVPNSIMMQQLQVPATSETSGLK